MALFASHFLSLILAVSAVHFASGVLGATCPLTGLAPEIPAQPIRRCPAASNLSCCSTCLGYSTSVSVLNINGGQIINKLVPSLGQVAGYGHLITLTTCDLFATNFPCLSLIETYYYALLCNPDAGNYFSYSNNTGTISVCNDFANTIYAECGTVTIPYIGSHLSDIIPTPSSMLAAFVTVFVGGVVPHFGKVVINIDTNNGTTSCFNGVPRNKVPPTPLCCDELTDTPYQCLAQQNVTKFANVINRTITSNCTKIEREPRNTALGPLASTPQPISSPPTQSVMPSPPLASAASIANPPPSTASSASGRRLWLISFGTRTCICVLFLWVTTLALPQ